MLLQTQFGVLMLQEQAPSAGSSLFVGQMAFREDGGNRTIHYVGVVHRRDDRPLLALSAGGTIALFAPAVAGALKEGKLDEAIKIADGQEESPGKVVVAGLQEFKRTR